MGEPRRRGQASERWRAVHHAAGELKALLSAIRFYGKGHSILEEKTSALYASLSADVDEHESLVLDVSSRALSFERRALFEFDNERESLTRPLFLDGVQQVIFDQGVTPSELVSLADAWAGAIDSEEDSLSSFVTDFWESELVHVRINAVESFAEGDYEESDGVTNRFELLIDKMASEGLFASDDADTSRMNVLRITREDLALLHHAGFGSTDHEHLKRHDRARRVELQPLDDAAAHELADALAMTDLEAVRRTLGALLDAVEHAGAHNKRDAEELVTRVLGALAGRRHLAILVGCVDLLLGGGDETRAMIHREAMGSEDVVGPLLLALEDADTRELALECLRHVPREATEMLLDRLLVLQAGDARAALRDLVLELMPAAVVLGPRISRYDPQLSCEMLERLGHYPPDEACLVLLAALAHPAPVVRVSVAAATTPARYPSLALALRGRIADPDPRMRHAVLDIVMRSNDRQAIASIGELLSSADLDAAELRRLVVALGRLGGREAGTVLRVQFERRSEAWFRADLLLALSRAEGEGARPVLEKYAKKIFVNRKVKEAAQEGLRRLETYEKDAGAPRPWSIPASGASAPPSDSLTPLASMPPDGSLPPYASLPPEGSYPPHGSLPPQSGQGAQPASSLVPAPPVHVRVGVLEEAPTHARDSSASPPESPGSYSSVRPRPSGPPEQTPGSYSSVRARASGPPAESPGSYRSVRSEMARPRTTLRSPRASSVPPNAREAAERALAAGELDRACELLQDLLERAGDDVEAYQLLARAHERAGRNTEAIEALTQAVMLEPGRVELAERLHGLRRAAR